MDNKKGGQTFLYILYDIACRVHLIKIKTPLTSLFTLSIIVALKYVSIYNSDDNNHVSFLKYL